MIITPETFFKNCVESLEKYFDNAIITFSDVIINNQKRCQLKT